MSGLHPPGLNQQQQQQQITQQKPLQKAGKPTIFTPFMNILSYFNEHIMYLNSSKYFAGILFSCLTIFFTSGNHISSF